MSEIEEGVSLSQATDDQPFKEPAEIKEGEDQIHIRNLQKVYITDESQTVVLEDFSLDIRKGELISIVGPSGCGKTTILRLIAGLIPPSGGTIYIGDRECSGPGADRGFVFQDFALFPWRSVRKNVEFGLEIAGVPKEERRERTDKYLKIVGLEKFADSRIHELSGGMKQRVAIARALACDPDVILCDEATSALDPITTNSVLDLLADLNARLGVTIVLITHEMRVARRICGRVAVVEAGRVCEVGPAAEVLTAPKSAAARKLLAVESIDGPGEDGVADADTFAGTPANALADGKEASK